MLSLSTAATSFIPHWLPSSSVYALPQRLSCSPHLLEQYTSVLLRLLHRRVITSSLRRLKMKSSSHPWETAGGRWTLVPETVEEPVLGFVSIHLSPYNSDRGISPTHPSLHTKTPAPSCPVLDRASSTTTTLSAPQPLQRRKLPSRNELLLPRWRLMTMSLLLVPHSRNHERVYDHGLLLNKPSIGRTFYDLGSLIGSELRRSSFSSGRSRSSYRLGIFFLTISSTND